MAKRDRPKKSKYPPAPPKKTERTEAKKWVERIQRAKKVKEEWRKQFRVDLCYEYFEGRHRPAHIPIHEWITINLIYSTLKATLPALYAQDPYYYVKVKKSYRPDPGAIALFETRAKIRQSHLNYLKGELDLKTKSRLSIFDAMFQFGVAKTFLRGDRIENPRKGEPRLGEDGRPVLDEDGAPVMESDYLLENKEYVVERLHPDDFLFDENAGPLESDWGWLANRIKRPLDEVKEDKTRTAAYRDYVKPTEVSDESEKIKEQRKKGAVYAAGSEPEADTVVEWEVYDLKKREWLIVSEGCNEFGIEPEPVPVGIEKHPFSILRDMLRDSSPYPIPPVSQLIDPQREYCESRSKLLTHLKRFNRKYTAYSAGFVNPEKGMTQLEHGEDGTVIDVSQPIASTIVSPIADAALDQQLHMQLAYLRKDFDDLAVGANQRGGTQGVDSATEAGILEKRTLIREGDAIGLVSDFLVSIGRKLDQLVQAHIDRDMAVRVVGPEGEAWETVKQEDYKEIDGEYEYSIAAGSTTPQLPEIERTQWISFLNLLASAPQLLLSKRLLVQTAKLHHIEDETMVEELYQIGQMMMSGELAMPGTQGSAPGTGGTPAARSGGGMGGVMNIRGGAA